MNYKEEYKEILDISINRARSSLKHFLKLIDLDPIIFKHLCEIDVIVDNGKSKRKARHNSKNNKSIVIFSEYLESLLDGLKNKKYSKQFIVNDIATTIIHETIATNKSVYVKDGNVSYEVIDYTVYEEDPVKLDSNYLNHLLSSVICDEEYFNSYVVVPLKIDYHGDNLYTVYAYNTVTNQYNIFENQFFKSSNVHEIADELNTNRLRYTVTRTFPCTEKFMNLVQDKVEDIVDVELSDAEFLEDCLTEIIAKFVLYSRKSNGINLDAFIDSISSEVLLPEQKLMVQMINKMGIKLIIWFLFSSFDDFYTDEEYKKYSDKYDKILNEFIDLAHEDEQIEFDKVVVGIGNILETKFN